jgi:hypothetical protein
MKKIDVVIPQTHTMPTKVGAAVKKFISSAAKIDEEIYFGGGGGGGRGGGGGGGPIYDPNPLPKL